MGIARIAGNHENAIQRAFKINEALGSINPSPYLWDHGSILVVDFDMAPVRPGSMRFPMVKPR